MSDSFERLGIDHASEPIKPKAMTDLKAMTTEEIVRLRKQLKAELNLRRLQPAVPMEVIDTMPKDEAEPVSRCNLQSPMEAEAQLQSCLNCGHPPHPEGQLPMASGSHVFFSRGREVRSSSTLTAEPQPQSAGPRCPECGRKMQGGFFRTSVNSASAIKWRCQGNDESFHEFIVDCSAKLAQFFPPAVPVDQRKPDYWPEYQQAVERCVKAEERVKELEGRLARAKSDAMIAKHCEQIAIETNKVFNEQKNLAEAERDALKIAYDLNREETAHWFQEAARFKAALSASPAQPDDLVLTKALEERDEYEEFIGDLALEMGCPEEWSNLHDHRSCVMRMVHELQAQLIESRGPAAGAETSWVSVEERLPEIGEEVLVYRPESLQKVTSMARYIRHEADSNFWWDAVRGGNMTPAEFVTHWQPLPSPPAAPAEDAPQAFLTDKTDEWEERQDRERAQDGKEEA